MQKKILLLEDESVIRDVLTEYLRMAEYEVRGVADGSEALKALEEETFDLAVLDIMVPEIDGLEVLAHIRRKKYAMGVIMLSALEDEGTQVRAFNAEADDYVVKPFSPILLLKRIGRILRRMSVLEVSEESSGLTLHQEAWQAFYRGKSLGLTLSEFLILQKLMAHPGWVFTREQLIETLYQEEYYGSDRAIDSHVKNLRKKLPISCVKTVVGVGYQYAEGETP